MNQTLTRFDTARGERAVSGIKISSPHCAGGTCRGQKLSVLQAFTHQENGRATDGQSRSSAGQKKHYTTRNNFATDGERLWKSRCSAKQPRSATLTAGTGGTDAYGTFSAEGKSRVKHYIFVSEDE